MKKINISIIFLTILISIVGCKNSENKRAEISLNGLWNFTATGYEEGVPTEFTDKAPVPGLVDMAGSLHGNKGDQFEDSIYWYRTKFTVDHKNKQVIKLKINKAKYHTRVFLNNKMVGENTYNFTPSVFDLKPFLYADNQENELVISVGCKNNLPDTVISGNDFEKLKYIPGIYDDVKLIVSDEPYIARVQTVPNPDKEQLRVIAEIETDGAIRGEELSYTIREVISGHVAFQGIVSKHEIRDENRIYFDTELPMQGCILWTPDNPFLYQLELSTSGDSKTIKFGMRDFAFSKENKTALLNGVPYYMRGTNVCIFRFFEDPDRQGLPWNRQWVIQLHKKFKEMHWNSIRYSIGFPPEQWYEIADSLGFLIQDEYPVWTGGKRDSERLLEGINPARLAKEYTEWVNERCNHPCVVIWDAQNESVTDITGKAIQLVRKLDLSERPWENGWGVPVEETDGMEAHPYLFSIYREGKGPWSGQVPSKDGPLKDLLSSPQFPGGDTNRFSPKANGERYQNPIIINEYAYFWINRDGSPTTLTDDVYRIAFPEVTRNEGRYFAYARTLGMLTEYWRAHRQCAAVMYFCGLGYSRPNTPRGETSDNFIDIKKLVYEPHFYRYVKPAFSPLGLMIDMWDRKLNPGSELRIPIHIINDTYDTWTGDITLSISDTEQVVSKYISHCELGALSKQIDTMNIVLPTVKDAYKLEAELLYKGEIIKSIRYFNLN